MPNNKAMLSRQELTVNFFDFSELSVSESGTLTPMGAVDIVLQLAQTANSTRTSFGCDANITSQIACKQALQSLLWKTWQQGSLLSWNRIRQIAEYTRSEGKISNENSLMSAKLRPQPTRAILHRIFTMRWEKIYFGRSTPSNAYIFTFRKSWSN